LELEPTGDSPLAAFQSGTRRLVADPAAGRQ
jgi:hypothetical protein